MGGLPKQKHGNTRFLNYEVGMPGGASGPVTGSQYSIPICWYWIKRVQDLQSFVNGTRCHRSNPCIMHHCLHIMVAGRKDDVKRAIH